MIDLSGKVAVVTGHKGGIGGSIFKAFRDAGAKVYGIDKKQGIDLTKLEYFPFQEGRIDVLVNCAGIAEGSWGEIIEVNLTAVYKMCLMTQPLMTNGGSIINITSLWSERGFKGNPAYGASKGGLKMLTKCLAVEWAKYNIRVNNLGLGYFKTDMTKQGWETKREQIMENIPLCRWGKPSDIVNIALTLASDNYITGQDFYVDGGWLASGGVP